MSNELYHHGIRGQKWGVRRFQNKDGTLTPAGRRHQSEDSDDAQNGSPKRSIDKATLAKGAAIAGAVALGAVLVTNPGARNLVAKYGKTAITSLGTAAGKGAANFMNKAPGAAAKFGGKVADRASKVGDAMIDAALLSAGGIAIAKVNEKYADQEGDSESDKNKKQILRDTIGAGIKTATSASGSSNSSPSKGGNLGKDVSEKIGPPSNKGVDKQSQAYQNLFKNQDADTRSTIKTLVSKGYDVDQVRKYLGDEKIEYDDQGRVKSVSGTINIKHAEFEDWASQYFAVGIGV